jgi:hypothetical protein
MEAIVKRSSELSVKTNAKKYTDFSTSQKFIGFIWDSVAKTVTLPPRKKEERLDQIMPFLQPGATFTHHNVEVLTTGCLNHVAFLPPQLRCYLRCGTTLYGNRA